MSQFSHALSIRKTRILRFSAASQLLLLISRAFPYTTIRLSLYAEAAKQSS